MHFNEWKCNRLNVGLCSNIIDLLCRSSCTWFTDFYSKLFLNIHSIVSFLFPAWAHVFELLNSIILKKRRHRSEVIINWGPFATEIVSTSQYLLLYSFQQHWGASRLKGLTSNIHCFPGKAHLGVPFMSLLTLEYWASLIKFSRSDAESQLLWLAHSVMLLVKCSLVAVNYMPEAPYQQLFCDFFFLIWRKSHGYLFHCRRLCFLVSAVLVVKGKLNMQVLLQGHC